MEPEDNLDDVLSSALEDLEKIEVANHLSSNTTTTSTTTTSSSTSSLSTNTKESKEEPKTNTKQNEEEVEEKKEEEMMNSFKEMMEKMMAGGGGGGTTNPNEPINLEDKEKLTQTFKDAVKNLNNDNANNSPGGGGFGPGLGNLGPEQEEFAKMLEELLKQDLEGGNTDPNLNEEGLNGQGDMFTGLMKQLFSPFLDKETFYPPMKSMKEKYEKMLNENKDKIGEEDFHRYEEQYKCISRMCAVYEKEPVDTNLIFEIMNEVNSFKFFFVINYKI